MAQDWSLARSQVGFQPRARWLLRRQSLPACLCRAGNRKSIEVRLQIGRWGVLGQKKKKPLLSHQMGTPMVPTFTVVFGNTETCLASEVPQLTHAAWNLSLSAIAPRLCHVPFRACLLARPQLLMLPYFPRRALCGKTIHLLSLSALDPA